VITDADLEDVERQIRIAEDRLHEIIELMHDCPFPEQYERVGCVMTMLDGFTEGQAKLLAAVAVHMIESLSALKEQHSE
jgi:hypothetical protein